MINQTMVTGIVCGVQVAEHVGGDFEQEELSIPDFDYAKVDPNERNVVRQPAEEQRQRQDEHQRGDTPPLVVGFLRYAEGGVLRLLSVAAFARPPE
ncbi:hypothetical protein T4E_126 [Trichinella pseudospiralis]|uniref:Uncharacterized protein n=1 Tax=Trichinella pseudospiralis TaxID=6337 RepID=A0A0V0YDX2_TRIPS|nr:hypothetical protein T4E_126 [Trichinella pseudospiralis]